jgi:hypothetical protein
MMDDKNRNLWIVILLFVTLLIFGVSQLKSLDIFPESLKVFGGGGRTIGGPGNCLDGCKVDINWQEVGYGPRCRDNSIYCGEVDNICVTVENLTTKRVLEVTLYTTNKDNQTHKMPDIDFKVGPLSTFSLCPQKYYTSVFAECTKETGENPSNEKCKFRWRVDDGR